MRLTSTFNRFFATEQASGLLLFSATVIALLVANSPLAHDYHAFWHTDWLGMSYAHWVNDGLMAIFFLLIGLELERELYVGELSRVSHALLPMIAALGGMAVPALLHFAFNHGLPTQAGIGIPMATDIAFALAVLSVLGARVPPALKVFLVAFAVIDDLGAAVMIAFFYTATLHWELFWCALVVLGTLILFNRLRVTALWPYLVGGGLLWWLTLQSGVHATLAGIALAFAIPFRAGRPAQQSASHRLEHALHRPVAFFILPIFAFANTGVTLQGAEIAQLFTQANSIGILLGLLIGKPIGVLLASRVAVAMGWCRLPAGTRWMHLLGAGMLGGIGFTMSIFITNLAFSDVAQAVNLSKLAILTGSVGAALCGAYFLHRVLPPLSDASSTLK